MASHFNSLEREKNVPDEFKPTGEIQLPAGTVDDTRDGYSVYDFRCLPPVTEDAP